MPIEPFAGNPIGYADTVNGAGQALSQLDCRYGVGAGAKAYVAASAAFFTLQVGAAAVDHVSVEAALGLTGLQWVKDSTGSDPWDVQVTVSSPGAPLPFLDLAIPAAPADNPNKYDQIALEIKALGDPLMGAASFIDLRCYINGNFTEGNYEYSRLAWPIGSNSAAPAPDGGATAKISFLNTTGAGVRTCQLITCPALNLVNHTDSIHSRSGIFDSVSMGDNQEYQQRVAWAVTNNIAGPVTTLRFGASGFLYHLFGPGSYVKMRGVG